MSKQGRAPRNASTSVNMPPASTPRVNMPPVYTSPANTPPGNVPPLDASPGHITPIDPGQKDRVQVTQHFIEHVLGEALCAERRLSVFTTPGASSRRFASAPEAVEHAFQRRATHNVYLGLGLIRGKPSGRGKAEDVAAIGALWADIDFCAGPHCGKPLPAGIEDAKRILDRIELAPSMLIDSGHGLHAYWLLKRPWIFAGADDNAHAASLTKGWHGLVCAAARELGWSLENLGDLARVLRLPGTLNHNGDEPVEVRVLSCDTQVRYSRQEFERLLPAAESPARRGDCPGTGMPPTQADISDRGLLERMFAAANGSAVRRLWDGSTEGYVSPSEADAALCAHLAFWTGGDRARIDHMFCQSGLCREKWLTRADYRKMTISKALEGLTETYRAEWKRQRQRSPEATCMVSQDAPLRNYDEIEVAGKNDSRRTAKKAIPVLQIRKTLAGWTGEWPRRVANLLFADEDGTIRYLETSEAAFAWLHERFHVYWATGQDVDGRSLFTKKEFVSHHQAVSTDYRAVEYLPHEPEIEGHYYGWRAPEGYEPTGEHLDGLLAFFDNPEAEADRTLIRAAFLTPAWGGLPGKRPAFAILAPDRGCGKSTLASVIGQLYGNPIELSITDTAEDKLVSRLLTPEALTKRVVRIDNIKGSYNSSFIEALITTPFISGHRLYHGEASRPNTLTFVLTGNSLRLSRDLTDRSFIIRLTKPDYQAEWEDRLYTYLTQHHKFILADIVYELQRPAAASVEEDRYAEWVRGVLARTGGDTDAVVSLNRQRRGECDEELEEAGLIMEAIDERMALILSERVGSQGGADNTQFTFITSTEMTELLRDSLKEALSARAVKRRLEGHIEAGRLPGVRYRRTEHARGYEVQVAERDGSGR